MKAAVAEEEEEEELMPHTGRPPGWAQICIRPNCVLQKSGRGPTTLAYLACLNPTGSFPPPPHHHHISRSAPPKKK